jgi:hypothetical protein
MQRTLNAGTVIATERADAFGDIGEILAADLSICQGDLTALKPRFWHPAKIHDDLDKIVIPFTMSRLGDCFRSSWWKHGQENIKIVGASELVCRSHRVTSPV